MRFNSSLFLVAIAAIADIAHAYPAPQPNVVYVTQEVTVTAGYDPAPEPQATTVYVQAEPQANVTPISVAEPVSVASPLPQAPPKPEEDQSLSQSPAQDSAPAPAPAQDSAPAPAPAQDSAPAPAPEPEKKDDSKLWGLTYSPYNDDGSCPSYDAVVSQLQKLSEVTHNIRLYSTDCAQLYNALKAISEHQLPLEVYAGIWIAGGNDRTQREINELKDAVKQYPNIVKGVSVGSEDLFRKSATEEAIINYMEQVRSMIHAENLGDIPVYTTETDSSYSSALADHSDLIQINVFSIFDGVCTDDMARQANVAIDRVESCRERLHTDKLIRIGESGWASAGKSVSNAKTSLDFEREYMKNFYCTCTKKNIQYFYFEAKDAVWKGNSNPLENNFGVFDSRYNNKIDLGFLGKC